MLPHSLVTGPVPHCHGGTVAQGLPGPRTCNEDVALSATHPTPSPFQVSGATRNWDLEESAGLESTSPRFKFWLFFLTLR